MKLLFVLPEYPPDYGGGIATFYAALLPELVRQGHEVHAAVGSAFVSGGGAYTRDGVRVTVLEGGRTERLLPAFSRYSAVPEVQRHLAAARALWEQAGGGDGFDVVEAVDWGMLFAPWVAEPGPPALVQLHGSSGQIGAYDTYPGSEPATQTLQLLEAGLLGHAAALHTHSRANAAFWHAQTGREVGLSPPPLPPADALGGPRGAAGFVAARVQAWKGPHVLAAALRGLGPGAPTVEWAGRVVAHPETGEPYDAHLARAFPDVWGRALRPVGTLAPAVVARKQAAAAFVVVPSVWDVYNLSVAEAMQQEAVVVCSDGAGGTDLVEHGRNGFRFPAGDDAALADLLARVGSLEPAERDRIGRAARETVVDATAPRAVAEAAAQRYGALRPAGPARPWLRAAVAPGGHADPSAFLHHLPLSGLLAHAAGRLRAKLPFA